MRPRNEKYILIGLNDRDAQSIRNWLLDYGLDDYLASALFLTACSVVISFGCLLVEGTLGNAQAAYRHFDLIGKIGMTVALIAPLLLQFNAWWSSRRRSQ